MARSLKATPSYTAMATALSRHATMTGRTGKRLYAKAIIRMGGMNATKSKLKCPSRPLRIALRLSSEAVCSCAKEKPSTVYTIPAAANAGTVVQSMDRI